MSDLKHSSKKVSLWILVLILFSQSLTPSLAVQPQKQKLPRISKPSLRKQSPPSSPQLEPSVLPITFNKSLATEFSNVRALKDQINNDQNQKWQFHHSGAWDDRTHGDVKLTTMHDLRIDAINIGLSGDNLSVSVSGKYGMAAGVRSGNRAVITGGSCWNKTFSGGFSARLSMDSKYNIIPDVTPNFNYDRCDATVLGNDAVRNALGGAWLNLVYEGINRVLDDTIETLANRIIKREVTDYLSSAIQSKNYRQDINEYWRSLQSPVDLKTEGLEDAWLVMNPETVQTPRLTTVAESISISLGITARPKVFYKKKPSNPDAPLPSPQGTATESTFHLTLESALDFDAASQMLEDELVKPDAVPNPGDLEIIGATVLGTGDQVVIKTRLRGPIEGAIYLVGRFTLEKENQRYLIRTHDLEFSVETKDKIKEVEKSVQDALNDPKFLAEIMNKARWDITERVQKAKEKLKERMNRKVSENKSIFLVGEVTSLAPTALFADENSKSFRCIVEARGWVRIEDR